MKRVRTGSIGILIQHVTTKEFYQGKGRWTSDWDKARNFNTCAEAVKKIREEKLTADILLAFGDSASDVAIPWR